MSLHAPLLPHKTDELLTAILNELQVGNMDRRLWSMDDIARYLNKSKITIQQRVVCKPDFPKAIRIPTHAGKLGPLWYPGEVKAYIKKYQSRK